MASIVPMRVTGTFSRSPIRSTASRAPARRGEAQFVVVAAGERAGAARFGGQQRERAGHRDRVRIDDGAARSSASGYASGRRRGHRRCRAPRAPRRAARAPARRAARDAPARASVARRRRHRRGSIRRAAGRGPRAHRRACRRPRCRRRACAASRRSAAFGGTSPNTVMQMLSGPLVVSPPISSQPKRSASANRPSLNAASQRSSARGRASASVNACGAAPIAARSDKLTASALWPSACGSTSAKKWRPSTSMSVDIASCWPAGGTISAQSSPMPSAARGDFRRLVRKRRRRCAGTTGEKTLDQGKLGKHREPGRQIRNGGMDIGAQNRACFRPDETRWPAHRTALARRTPCGPGAFGLFKSRQLHPNCADCNPNRCLIGATMRSNFYSNLACRPAS